MVLPLLVDHVEEQETLEASQVFGTELFLALGIESRRGVFGVLDQHGALARRVVGFVKALGAKLGAQGRDQSGAIEVLGIRAQVDVAEPVDLVLHHVQDAVLHLGAL